MNQPCDRTVAGKGFREGDVECKEHLERIRDGDATAGEGTQISTDER